MIIAYIFFTLLAFCLGCVLPCAILEAKERKRHRAARLRIVTVRKAVSPAERDAA